MPNERSSRDGPRIYNPFPLLAGPFPRWNEHLERARRMEFDWIFLNPFHRAGYSGSLYWEGNERCRKMTGGVPRIVIGRESVP
jgi:hypothetical protein